ncbi:MAG: hypothetical protein IPJ18_00160 [Betaproteobacteria bacterium]|nr:hypothetical protein [Betaproteobacteria bacterium]
MTAVKGPPPKATRIFLRVIGFQGSNYGALKRRTTVTNATNVPKLNIYQVKPIVILAVFANMMLAEQNLSWLMAMARSTAEAGMPLPVTVK